MAHLIRRDELDDMDFSDVSIGESLAPVTPGDVLRAEFMEPLGLSARALSRELEIPTNRVTGVINGERSVTADTALLFARRFGTTPEFWMNLQSAHDLEIARKARTVYPAQLQNPDAPHQRL